MKYIEFETSKGRFLLPIEVVVANRTKYYVEKRINNGDLEQSIQKEIIEESGWVINDDFEAIDWMLNNMDFIDVEKFCIKVGENETKRPDGEDDWSDSDDFEIVEI